MPKEPIELMEKSEYFINRELSWIEFNRRVLEEAKNPRHPLLERVKFLSIFASNLDEFMMIRVSGLRRQVKGGVLESPPDGLTPSEQLTEIRKELKLQIREADQIWRDQLLVQLQAESINIHRVRDLPKKKRMYLREYFEKEIFPALTPMSFDVGRPFPFISNLSLNLAVIINDRDAGMQFSRLKIPRDMLKRLIPIPSDEYFENGESADLSSEIPADLSDISNISDISKIPAESLTDLKNEGSGKIKNGLSRSKASNGGKKTSGKGKNAGLENAESFGISRPIPPYPSNHAREFNFVFAEDLIAVNADLLFPEMDIVQCYPFVVTRDADIEIEEDEASDLLTAIEESVELRRIGSPVRLEVNRSMPKWVRTILAQKLSLSNTDVYTIDDPLRKSDLMELMNIDRPDLKDKPFMPAYPHGFEDNSKNIFHEIKQGDVLLYHPYNSFNPVINLIKEAAHDPQVIAIKQTLYRVGKNSPIVQALMEARDNGKQVSVMVELKARFDEENNIEWAKKLEDCGVHVVYGLVGIKVHAKLCMIVRREKEGLITYVHFGTGNYNPNTSRIYTDIGVMTCDKSIALDTADLFNALTGHSGKKKYDSLLVSYGKNGTMREDLTRYIENEIASQKEHGNGYIAMKLNQLVDPKIILSLYKASQAGVKIDLQVRGICALRPGLKGVSENITCTSIVGRFLEHSRIYYFKNNDYPIVLIGSADMMTRNLDRRVEILVPIKDPRIKRDLIRILNIHLSDTENCTYLLADGSYVKRKAGDKSEVCDAQALMIENRGEWNEQHI